MIRRNSHQIIPITVASAGQKIEFNGKSTKTEHKLVKGVFAVVSNDAGGISDPDVGSTIALNIDSIDVLVENFDIALIKKDKTIPIGYLPYKFETPVKAGGTEIKGYYQDGSLTGVTYPYTVKLYLETEYDATN